MHEGLLAYTNSSDSDVLVGVFSTHKKALEALEYQFEIKPDDAKLLVQEAELDHVLGDN